MDNPNPNNRLTTRDVYDLVDRKVDKLRKEMLHEFELLNENHFQGIYKKFDNITWWLIGLLSTVVASLIILLLTR